MRKLNLLTGLLITMVMAVLMLMKFPPLEALEERSLDYRFKLRGRIKPPDNIIIAAIDEKGIERFGRWPWRRDVIARLVDRLNEAGSEIIMFDIILSEEEKNDRSLARAIDSAGNVVLPIVFDLEKEVKGGSSEALKDSAFKTIIDPEVFDIYNPITAKGVLIPVPEIIRSAMALGHINMFPDYDGTLRWEALIVRYNGRLYPSITLQTAAKYLGVPPERVILKAGDGVLLGRREIPTDRWGRTLINYYGPDGTFPHISISDIVDGKVEPQSLQGKIVLIGATAVGIYDLRVTPFSPAMPGVEKHAHVIASILEGRFTRGVAPTTNLIILLSSGLLLSMVVARFKAIGASIITVLLLLILSPLNYYLFAHKGLWVNILYPSSNILIIFITVTAYNYAVEERYARRIRAMFSSYVTERVVNELIKDPGMARLGGERREVTVLFSDVMGFTSFSERHTPEEVVAILNEYLEAMTEVILRWEGTLDKFIGDAIFAFWGAPLRQDDHAELAVRCAMDMVRRLEELQEKWKSQGKTPLDMGIGINTGEVLVGNIGCEGKKMDYTVIGDHVNLGSRVEGLTRRYNTHILITEFTLTRIRGLLGKRMGHISIKGLERIAVKGKERPVGIYEVMPLEDGIESRLTEVEGEGVVVMEEK